MFGKITHDNTNIIKIITKHITYNKKLKVDIMKKIWLLSLIVVLAFAMTACGNNNAPTGPTFSPFIGGTEGLQLEFMPGMPPDQDGAILDNGQSPFSVGVKVVNKGEYDLEPNQLKLSLQGILPEQFNLQWSDLEKVLQDPLSGGKKLPDGSVSQGQTTTLSFDGLSYMPDARGDITKSFRVDACYHYQTKSTSQICITNHGTDVMLSDEDKKICTTNGPKTTSSSGGPVQITNVREAPQGDSKATVMFSIEQKGTGTVYAPQPAGVIPSNCEDSIVNTDKNVVHLKIYLSDQSAATTQISCTGGAVFSSTTPISATESNPLEADVKLFYDDANPQPKEITCTIESLTPVSQKVLYQDLLNVDVDYNYGQTLSKTIVVKDIGSPN